MTRPGLLSILPAAWRDARRVRLWLPLFGLSLMLAVVQTWPLIDNRALHNPYLNDLATGGSDAWLLAALSNPQGASMLTALYLLSTVVLTAVFAGAYNFISGAMLAAWAGQSSFWRGGARYFLSFVVLGLLLIIAGTIGLAIGAALMATGSGLVGGIAAVVLLQLVNVIGEYARALAVSRQRRNPFAMAARSAGFVARHFPAVALLAVLGLLAQAALLIMLAQVGATVTIWSPLAGVIVQQMFVFGILWVKVLRLAVAAQLVRAEGAATGPA
ncbi:MAG: hypothetical protein HZB53_14835 [Chloroflexi bacterium]|nr:hypothetical protein [Chloroflexota bacterium]